MMRLDKFLSETTPYSRKDIRSLVKAGRVLRNGQRVKAPEKKTDELHDVVTVDGEVIAYRKFIYLMMNKPAGYLSATEDKVDPIVVSLIPEQWQHYAAFPVGRLDKDTEGLLLLTNDGQFDHLLMSPKRDVYKRYYAELDQPATAEDVAAFSKPMEFKEFTSKPAKLEICADNPSHVFVEIAEGKFHQVKRMCERVGKTVLYLKRVAIGPLEIDKDLPLGEVRELTDDEIRLLTAGGK